MVPTIIATATGLHHAASALFVARIQELRPAAWNLRFKSCHVVMMWCMLHELTSFVEQVMPVANSMRCVSTGEEQLLRSDSTAGQAGQGQPGPSSQ
jgi:hypothetical protein